MASQRRAEEAANILSKMPGFRIWEGIYTIGTGPVPVTSKRSVGIYVYFRTPEPMKPLPSEIQGVPIRYCYNFNPRPCLLFRPEREAS